MLRGVLAGDCHAGVLLTFFCLESKPGHQQTPPARSGELPDFILFQSHCLLLFSFVSILIHNSTEPCCQISPDQKKQTAGNVYVCSCICSPSTGWAFLASEWCCSVCAGRPRLELDSHWAGEEAGLWGPVEDHGLGPHHGSADAYGAHQSRVSNVFSYSGKWDATESFRQQHIEF